MSEEIYWVGRSDGNRGKAIHLIMHEIFLACTVPKDKETIEKHGDDLTELACVKLGNSEFNLSYKDVTCKNCLKIAYNEGLLERPKEVKDGKKKVAQKNVEIIFNDEDFKTNLNKVLKEIGGNQNVPDLEIGEDIMNTINFLKGYKTSDNYTELFKKAKDLLERPQLLVVRKFPKVEEETTEEVEKEENETEE